MLLLANSPKCWTKDAPNPPPRQSLPASCALAWEAPCLHIHCHTRLLQVLTWGYLLGHCPLTPAQPKWAQPGSKYRLGPALSDGVECLGGWYLLSCQGCGRLQLLHLHAWAPGKGTFPARMEMWCLDMCFIFHAIIKGIKNSPFFSLGR